ncbi:endonuclease/exonuclease/phosphatase family protein [Fulvivirgaceae bacterium BMA10]|uniref:Endonuclease/exonuclease/phosphatase family protein n=1 Tax=Splendidivirga corallicola TaxID=3051826 RepID=A0ABT8KHQ5_9BACT|nr:endonuclease/exonuclease/phosphatase family protein [Fulvivirgaceae bacterium BMA10]
MCPKIKWISFALIFFFYCTARSQTPADNSRIVKVLSFNILHGATTKGDFNLDVLAKVIKEADPDFVALQEVDFKTNRAKGYDLVTELGLRTKMAPLFARAMPFDGGEYGEGILSKWTFLQTRNVALPFTPGNEPRAAAEVSVVIASGDTISFIGTHFDHLKDDRDRVAQAKKVNKVFSQNTYPSILAGDLNDVPGSEAINALEEMWKASYDKTNPKPTFPSDNPKRKIDYVMFYPAHRWRVLETKIIQDTIASDHCAYLVTLELLEEN